MVNVDTGEPTGRRRVVTWRFAWVHVHTGEPTGRRRVVTWRSAWTVQEDSEFLLILFNSFKATASYKKGIPLFGFLFSS